MSMEWIINFLYPSYCINCWKTWQYLCKNCKSQLKSYYETCPVCHKISKWYIKCLDCQSNKEIYYEWIMISFKYWWILKKLILWLKYWHKKEFGKFLAEKMQYTLLCNQLINQENIFLSYVPSHRIKKFFIKWYNQSELLCNHLSYITNIPIIKLCNKIKYTFSQTKYNKQKRLFNLKQSFAMHTDSKLNLNWKEAIIIIDDITTTWSTINEMAKTIKKNYPNIKIRWLVLGKN